MKFGSKFYPQEDEPKKKEVRRYAYLPTALFISQCGGWLYTGETVWLEYYVDVWDWNEDSFCWNLTMRKPVNEQR